MLRFVSCTGQLLDLMKKRKVKSKMEFDTKSGKILLDQEDIKDHSEAMQAVLWSGNAARHVKSYAMTFISRANGFNIRFMRAGANLGYKKKVVEPEGEKHE